MSLLEFLFYLFAATACGGALGVVICQNIVRMAVSLIVSLSSVSGLFFLLHADFVGATQLMVYVGGTIVLLIFGVMLTSNSPFLKIKNSPADMFLAGGIGVLFMAMIMFTVGSMDWSSGQSSQKISEGYNAQVDGVDRGNTLRPLALSFVGLRTDKPLRIDGEGAPGYLLPFEIVSVHLLVVLVGAAYLARPKRRVEPTVET
jgi:NADH-quinone oxidoreductase subunit J